MEFSRFITEKEPALRELLRALCAIPAPSHHEEKRARFCKEWLEKNGAAGVYIDEALNVVYPMNCEGCDDITVFMAHTDVVFPDTEALPFSKDEENFYAPGIGDDTANLVMLLLTAKFMLEQKITPKGGILFVCNSCEEGLGNLKGVRQIFRDYAGRIKQFVSFDGFYCDLADRCVGSHRYEIELATEGGHSFGAFGNRNAIHAAADLICALYDCTLPTYEGSKTTYNVGIIEGGTSVNTIAQNAKLLYEYRSDDARCLAEMRAFFEDTIKKARARGLAEISVRSVGERPCGGKIDREKLERMSRRVAAVSQKHSGLPCTAQSGSTDCNIPMSLGVPAVCVGTYLGDGQHTREEKVLLSSIPVGTRIAAELILEHFS